MIKTETYTDNVKECCASCKNCIRVKCDNGIVTTYCCLDDHYIGYVRCFIQICEKWVKADD